MRGQGKANFTFEQGTYVYRFDWNYVNKKGVRYAQVINPEISFELKRAYIYFENLFGGDKALGTAEFNHFRYRSLKITYMFFKENK